MLRREPPEDPMLGVTCVSVGTIVIVSRPVTVLGEPSPKKRLILVEVSKLILVSLNTPSVSVKVKVS